MGSYFREVELEGGPFDGTVYAVPLLKGRPVPQVTIFKQGTIDRIVRADEPADRWSLVNQFIYSDGNKLSSLGRPIYNYVAPKQD